MDIEAELLNRAQRRILATESALNACHPDDARKRNLLAERLAEQREFLRCKLRDIENRRERLNGPLSN